MCQTIKPRHVAAWVVVVSLILPTVSWAAETAAEQQYQSALDTMLADIGDPQKSFDFVQFATQVGDLRGAVAALERMLLINPSLANIQLELGVLYLRLGNAELARYHISQALRAPNVPAVVRSRAERYLAVAGAVTRRNFLRGQLSLGYRYDSNANGGPSSALISVFDPFLDQAVLARLSDEGLERKDTSIQAVGLLEHSYAFGSSGSSWDSALSMAAAWYQEITNLNQVSANLNTGPSLVLNARPDSPLRLRPFVAGGLSMLDNDDYYRSVGGGIELSLTRENRSSTALQMQYLNQDFEDTPTRFLSDRSGGYLNAVISQIWQAGRVQYGVFATGEQANADADYQAYSRYGAGLNLRVFFSGVPGNAPSSVYVTGQYRQTDYDAADSLIDPNTVREDKRTDAAVGIDVPVMQWLSVNLAGGYMKNDSNLPNFTNDDVSASLNLIARF